MKIRHLKSSHVLCCPEYCALSNSPHASDVCLYARENVRSLLLRGKCYRPHNSGQQRTWLDLKSWKYCPMTSTAIHTKTLKTRSRFIVREKKEKTKIYQSSKFWGKLSEIYLRPAACKLFWIRRIIDSIILTQRDKKNKN